jgi:thiamine-monophosphate kinase
MGALTTHIADSIASRTEEEIIQRVVQNLSDVAPAFPEGPGGDCAHLPNQDASALRISTVDSVILGRHFDVACSGYLAGMKLVNRNLSDLAAAGATPSDSLLSLVMGGEISQDWLEDFAHGISKAARAGGLKVVGGDVAKGPAQSFIATLAVQGYAQRVLTRRQAQNGDVVFVTGKLGGSRYGHHLTFSPRLTEGAWLGTQGDVTGCTDISDGLCKDLVNLLGPKLDLHIDLNALPVSDAAGAMTKADGIPAVEHALYDGEDYELLWTVQPERADFIASQFRQKFPQTLLTCLGTAQTGTGQLFSRADGQPLGKKGFNHFG